MGQQGQETLEVEGGSSSTIIFHFPKVKTVQAALSTVHLYKRSFFTSPSYSIIHPHQELDGCAFLTSLKILKLVCCDS